MAKATRGVSPEEALALVDPDRKLKFIALLEGAVLPAVAPRKRGVLSDEDSVDLVCDMVSVGVTLTSACAAVGLSPTTWYAWAKKNFHRAGEKYAVAIKYNHAPHGG